MSSPLLSLRAFGGPFDGQENVCARESHLFWVVQDPHPHLVATTSTLEYHMIREATGVYQRQAKKGAGRAVSEEILYYRPLPGKAVVEGLA